MDVLAHVDIFGWVGIRSALGWVTCNMVIRLSPQRPGPNPASRNRHLINLPQSVSNQERRPKRKARIYFISKKILLEAQQTQSLKLELSLQLKRIQIQFHG